MTHQHLRFPSGLYAVPNYEDVCQRYNEAIPHLAKEYPLPPELPCRHPLLQRLEGTLPVEDSLPLWWNDCVDALVSECPPLESLLRPLSREEFRKGAINRQRWNQWRKAESQLIAEQLMAFCPWQKGPSLYWILYETLLSEQRQLWLERWNCRGNKDIPRDLHLVITALPEWWLNMSNGHGWYTCMGNGEDRDPRIIGNWYDTGVLLAALVARGNDCWTAGSLIVRTTLRVVWEYTPPGSEEGPVSVALNDPHIVLGQVYHNDMTAACAMVQHLARYIEMQGLAWGCIAGTNALHFARNGSSGIIVVDETSLHALGVTFWRPENVEEPYLDGDAFYREFKDREHGGYWSDPSLSCYPCHLHETECSHATEQRATEMAVSQ